MLFWGKTFPLFLTFIPFFFKEIVKWDVQGCVFWFYISWKFFDLGVDLNHKRKTLEIANNNNCNTRKTLQINMCYVQRMIF